MTSRQPGTALLVRLLPLALLIILGLAGLRGAVSEPSWNGPLHRDGLIIGLVLEVLLGTLLVITLRRHAVNQRAVTVQAAPVNAVAVKLRTLLIFVLSAGLIAVAVTLLIGLHLHLFTARPRMPSNSARPRSRPSIRVLPPGSHRSASFHFPVAVVLYALLIVVLIAGVGLSIWWARRLRPPTGPRDDDFVAEDSQDLREAVESGRSALRTLDDARAAIIACYVAMETHLAERGAARAIADTPDELLTRARQTGLVRGTAAARLTALFYEARFSSHSLDRGRRDEAERALDELAAALAQPEGGQAEAGQAGAGQAEAATGAGATGAGATGAGG